MTAKRLIAMLLAAALTVNSAYAVIPAGVSRNPAAFSITSLDPAPTARQGERRGMPLHPKGGRGGLWIAGVTAGAFDSQTLAPRVISMQVGSTKGAGVVVDRASPYVAELDRQEQNLDLQFKMRKVKRHMNESLTQAFAPWRGLELDSAAIEEALANAYNLGFYELMGRYKALACDYFLLTNEFFKWSRFSRGIEDSLCIVMTGFLITALSKCGIKAAPHEFDRPHDLPTPRIPDHFVTLIQWRIIADLTFGQYDPNWAGRFLVDDDIARYEKRLMEAMRAANQRWSSDPTQTSEQLRRAFNTARAA